MSALVYSDVAVGYGEEAVLSGVSLSVAPGEVVGVVGPNGAGKTTLLRAVTGGARVLTGSIQLEGRPIAGLPARERARIVGVLPQKVSAEASFSAAEFVEMGRHARQGRFARPTARDREVVTGAMERTDTLALAADPVDILSGGDLQRLALAQALAQEPRVLLLDEPTSHLDINHRLQMLDLCRGLAADGLAVLGVFHDLDLAARYADRIVVVAEGRLVEDASPEVALRPELIREVFKVRAVVHRDLATQAVSVTPLLREDDVATRAKGRVLVVGGSGQAAWLLGRLVRDGWEVTLAAVSVGDTDLEVARVLGVPAVEMAPFGQMSEHDEREVASLAKAADAVLVSATPFGRANVGNLRATLGSGHPTVLVGTMDEERDYAGGEARELWTAAVDGGALEVADERAAVTALMEVV